MVIRPVLNYLECNLVLNLFDLKARRGLVLHDESLDLIVGKVARPDDRDVAPRGRYRSIFSGR